MPEKSKPEVSLATEIVERKVVGSNPNREGFFRSLFLLNRAIMIDISCQSDYSVLGGAQSL